jgi:hypothetical protein
MEDEEAIAPSMELMEVLVETLPALLPVSATAARLSPSPDSMYLTYLPPFVAWGSTRVRCTSCKSCAARQPRRTASRSAC